MRNTNRKKYSNRQGMAFLVVMGIIGILLIAGISMTLLTGQSAFTSRKLYAGEQALSIAESGVADRISKMSTNYTYWMERTNTGSFAGGTFSVNSLIDTATAHVIVYSTGTFQDESREVAMEILGTIYDLYDRSIGIAGAIICGSDAILDTSAMVVYGGVHANGDIISTKGNPNIYGDLSAVGTSDITAEAGFTTSTNAAPLIVPSYLPLDSWKALAETNGIYYSGDTVFSGHNLEPSNGVVYVEGSVEIAGNSSMIGTLVASENITINNRFNQTPFNTNWPALIGGIDVNLHNRNEYTGVIFAGNNVSMMNRRSINGSVIALNEVTIANGATIDPPPQTPAWDPNDTNEAPPQVVVGGWLK